MNDVQQSIERFDAYRVRLEEYAAFDLLTGLLNRRAAEDRLKQSFSLAQRGHYPLAVTMLDLDDFKQINDRFGHAAGDLLLVAVAAQLQASVRGADWAARWGGEEFLLLLHTNEAGAATALERLRQVVAEVRVNFGEAEIACTLSAGATVASPSESPAEVIQRADAALYEAKNAGRDCVRFSH
jgi:diguanylate cyclase (GGDEF)-like protein